MAEGFNSLALTVAKQELAKATPRMNVVAATCLIASGLVGMGLSLLLGNPFFFIVCMLLGLVAMMAPRIAMQWERAIVLRLGRYQGLRGPGLFWVVPLLDQVVTYIDQRTIVTDFAAESTLTSDTVPVNVDAIMFWVVYDAEKAALEVQNYRAAVSLAAQTALRDVIGKTSLTDLLRGRGTIEEELQRLIDERTNP
jgi:regulator of protease activity HflC (stomatin/prohibitin superfamily)